MISPTDPVIKMLTEMVKQYDQRVADLEEAVTTLMQINSQAFASLNARLMALEQTALSTALQADFNEGGKEL